ncbi:DUF975 family protein [Lactobacillaceae bacterium Scapto_B20]
MKFSDLKTEAKDKLNPHYGFFLLLLLPNYILGIFNVSFAVSSVSDLINRTSSLANGNVNSVNSPSSGYFNPTNLISLFAQVLLLSAIFVMIKVMRGQENDYTGGFKKAFNIFTRGDYFFGAFVVGVLKYVYLLLWGMLCGAISVAIIAGGSLISNDGLRIFVVALGVLAAIASTVFVIIKQLAYSQAQFLFRDSIDNGQPLSYNASVTASRQLMNGHKGEFFLLILSFILWYILGGITFGLANIFYVTPYTKLTFANYYVHLTENNNA